MSKPLSFTWDPELTLTKVVSGVSIPTQSVVNSSQKLSIYQQLPLTAPNPSCLSSSANTITFKLDSSMRNNIHYLQTMLLKFKITNTAGTLLNLVDGYSLINTITFSRGGNVISALSGPAMRENLLVMADSDSKVIGAAAAAFIDPETGLSTLNIAAGQSATVIVNIYECFASVGNVPLFLLNPELQIDVVLRYGTQCLATGTVAGIASAQLSDFYMILCGEQLTKAAADRVVEDIKAAGKVLYRFTDHVFQDIPLQSVTADQVAPGQSYNTQGQVFFVNAMLVNNAAASGDVLYYDTEDLKALDLLHNNTIVNHNLGAGRYTSDIYEALSSSWFPSGKTIALLNRIGALFTERFAEAVRNGSQYGLFNASGNNMQIVVTPGATIANASLYTYSHRYSSLLVEYDGYNWSYTAYPGNVGLA